MINKLRGDPALLGDGSAQLEARCGIPTVGVLPWVEGPGLDAEDSLALRAPASDVSVPLAEVLDVAVAGAADAAETIAADGVDAAMLRFNTEPGT